MLEPLGHLLLVFYYVDAEMYSFVELPEYLTEGYLSLGVVPVKAKRGPCRMKAKIHVPAVTSGCNLRLVSLTVSSYFSFFPTHGSSSRHRSNFLHYLKYSVHLGYNKLISRNNS